MKSLEALNKLYMACDSELLYEQCGILFPAVLTDVIEQDLELLQELVDKEKPIFENSCNAIFDENLLYKAIDWKCQNLNKYCHKKYKVYLYNNYPCISIAHQKIRIHQLLGEFIFGRIRKGYVIHHIDGNKLNNTKENLQYISNVLHTQIHHKG